MYIPTSFLILTLILQSIYFNFNPLEVVYRYRDPPPEVVEN